MLDATVQFNKLSPEETIRVALLVEYCGRDFYGSQYQPDRPTVQLAIQDGLQKLNLETSAVSFAGRTDSGVNARGQVAHFDILPEALKNIRDLASALNAVLPETVSVRDVALTTRAFNSRKAAGAKWYRYAIYNHRNRSAVAQGENTAHYRRELNAERMHQAAQLLIGTHDFASFKDSDTDVTDNVCQLRHAAVKREGDVIIFDVVANRFLYKMVRNIAGQLIDIGNTLNGKAPEAILDVLAAQDRKVAAATARPEGLTLMAIAYPAPYDFFAADSTVRQLENLLNNTKLESLQNENLFRKAS